MYEPILLQKTIIEDPFLFPDCADNVLMFLGAKEIISFDERVRDVRLGLQELENHDKWVKSGMPDESVGDYVVPNDAQIEAARKNTLDAIYHNSNVRGLYIHCRRDDIDALFESADKAASFLTARTPVKGKTGKDFHLRIHGDNFEFHDEAGIKPDIVDGEPEISDSLKSIINLSAHFAVAGRLFREEDSFNFPNQFFFPHVPQAIRSMLLLPHTDTTTLTYQYNRISNEAVMSLHFEGEMADQSRMVVFPKASMTDRYSQSHITIEAADEVAYEGPLNMNVFFNHIFAPLMNDAISRRGRDVVISCIEKHLDIFALTKAGAVPRPDFIKDFVL